MASTTKTANLELSQFVGTDKPAWLTDYNGDMQKIDDGYKKLEDANTATQADLDATKQDLSGSKTDINDVKANVQALEAQDIALGNRVVVLEGNYDTMHHELAVAEDKLNETAGKVEYLGNINTVSFNKTLTKNQEYEEVTDNRLNLSKGTYIIKIALTANSVNVGSVVNVKLQGYTTSGSNIINKRSSVPLGSVDGTFRDGEMIDFEKIESDVALAIEIHNATGTVIQGTLQALRIL